ncbi:MAG: hypothetical protein EZS28_010458 [Streblomastix strix]|uniref:Uncharacterized protein n=1 Tax=Streblomastix strix TaxID=222440 RepID=A0A5J4WGF0_9EUKA|nr:MAG: hypothetical protein EZS28_010458 [Streblomastix strix]
MGANATAVDRFTHHSDVASTVRQYYDKNIYQQLDNDKVRALIAEVKEESACESESEIEAEKELGLANHTPGTMGLSPKEEFSPIATFFEINNSQQIFIKPNSHTSESFQHIESNKQRGSSPSVQEVMHDLKGHAISSEIEVSSTFVPPVHGSPARKKKKKNNQKDGAPTCPKSVSARGEGKEQQQNRKGKSNKESK